ncbi:MAG: hypothetical protein R6V49_07795 [Bacteroidales bacterium]
MRKNLPVVVLFLTFVMFFETDVKAQFFGENTRISIGLNVLSALSEDPAFMPMGPSSKMKLPSLRINSDREIIEGTSFNLNLSSGFGLVPRGFRYNLSPDTVLAFKESGWTVYAGLGVTYNDIEFGTSSHPLSFYLYGFGRMGLITTSWINNEQVYKTLWDDDSFGYNFGLSTRIYFGLWEGISWNIDVFHAADYILKDFAYNESLFPYRSLTNSLGVSFSYSSGDYVPWRR